MGVNARQIANVSKRFFMLGERWVGEQSERLQVGEVAARDDRILSLEGEVAAREARILSLEGEAAAREARILSLGEEVANRDGRILSLEGEVAARDARVLSLKAEVNEANAEAACRNGAEEELAVQGRAQASMNLEVILVDNYSTDGTAQQLARAIRRGFGGLHDTGNWLTGGGLRSLTKRVVTEPLRGAVSRPFLKTIGRSVLSKWRRSLDGEVAAREARIRLLEGEVAVRTHTFGH
jgi:hypothetical protein